MRSTSLFAIVVLVVASAESALGQSPNPESSSSSAQVTFNKDVAPLIFKQCSVCHRSGEVAPFPLLSYSDAKKRAKLIQTVTAKHYMPPWKSVARHGRFIDERRLTEEEITLIDRWVEQGAAEGDSEDLPKPPEFRDGWKLGEPDIVLTMPEAFQVPAEGNDIYRNFVFSLEIPAGKFIKAAEYRPSNRRIVHHAVLAMDASGNSRKKDAADPAPGFKGSLNLPGQMFPGSLAAWTPGRDPIPLPDGFSMPWPQGADLVMQLHLHPSGKPESEQSNLAIYLTEEPPRRSMVDLMLIDRGIDIPPGESAYRTRDELTLPIDVDAFGIFPHMHLIGRAIKVTAHPPEGKPFSLLWINDWDFNWQNYYQYAEPVRLVRGTRIVMDAIHDNSADNFRNPNAPPRRVTWGEQTTDEMSVAMLQLVPVNADDMKKFIEQQRERILGQISSAQPATKSNAPAQQVDAKQILAKYDRDQDGKLNLEEMAAATGKKEEDVRRLVSPFDSDADGLLNEAEIAAAMRALKKP